MVRVFISVVALTLLSCGPLPKLGQTCTTSHDESFPVCVSQLVCVTGDSAVGTKVTGVCRQPCTADRECPTGCTCTQKLSAENGGGLVCAGSGC